MQVTLEQVHNIINSYDGNQTKTASVSEIKSTSYSHTASWTSYHIALSDPDRSYLLLASPTGNLTAPGSITFPVLSVLLTQILATTAVPVPRPVAQDIEGSKWPFDWSLFRVPQTRPTTLASVRDKLSPRQLARIQLRLGTYLRALHGITNDWFGIPTDQPREPPALPSFTDLISGSQTSEEAAYGYGEDMIPYSWQDTFVLQLEELLEYVCGDAKARKTALSGNMVEMDVDELRRALSRAIGSFLFDDVEMPRLIWVTGNEEDVIVSLTAKQGGEEEAEADIAYILPTFGRALWGDPLMEAWFLPPGASSAMKEGYFDGEKDMLVVFPRDKTKRVWYTVYLALAVLAEGVAQGRGKGAEEAEEGIIQWARKILPECVEILKDAPCY